MKAQADKLEMRFALMAAVFTGSLGMALYFSSLLPLLVPIGSLLFYGGWQERKILFFLLIAALPLSFELHLNNGLSTDVPAELLMVMVMIIFVAAWLFSPALLSRKQINHPLLLILLFYFLWTIVACVFSTHSFLSLKYILAKSWYTGAFIIAALVMFQDKKNIALTGLILLSILSMVVFIILSHHALLGFRFATVNKAVAPFFRNHVNYGAMLVCLVPVAWTCFKLASGKRRVLLFCLLIILLVALYFSYSRGAWVALIAGIIAALLMQKQKLLVAYIILIIAVTGCFLWLRSNDNYLRFAPDFKTTVFHPNFKEHWVATYKLKDVSTAERFYRWVAGIRMVADKPLLGFGPNSFYDEYKPYAIPAYKTWVSNNPEHSTVHNYFLLTATEQGIPGLILLLLLLGAMIYYAEKLYNRSTDNRSRQIAITIGMIIMMLIVLNFLSDLVETDKIGSIFFLCIAALAALHPSTPQPLNLSTPPPLNPSTPPPPSQLPPNI